MKGCPRKKSQRNWQNLKIITKTQSSGTTSKHNAKILSQHQMISVAKAKHLAATEATALKKNQEEAKRENPQKTLKFKKRP